MVCALIASVAIFAMCKYLKRKTLDVIQGESHVIPEVTTLLIQPSNRENPGDSLDLVEVNSGSNKIQYQTPISDNSKSSRRPLEKNEVKPQIPAHSSNKVIITQGNSCGESIPKINSIDNKCLLKNANKLVQQKFNDLIFSDLDCITDIDLKLSKEVSEKVAACQSGAKICGLEKDVDKIMIAQLLQNSIPNLIYLAASDFVQLKLKEIAFSGVLVLIDDICGIDVELIPKTSTAKVIILDSRAPDDKDLKQASPQLQHLDQESQEKLRMTRLRIFGKQVQAHIIFGPQIYDFTITEILSLKHVSATTSAKEETGFYVEQRIFNEGGQFDGTAEDLAKH